MVCFYVIFWVALGAGDVNRSGDYNCSRVVKSVIVKSELSIENVVFRSIALHN